MLGGCTDILKCEEILSEATKSVRLLGEVPLSDEDIEILSNLVKHHILASISKGTRYLRVNAPASFACFLVSVGRFYDKEAGYWPMLEKKVGPIDVNWQGKWGKFFLEFLNKNRLPKFDEETGLKYVTPILGHVCIPDNCLEEYFERVLVALVQRDLSSHYDRDEIIYDLEVKRKINQNRLELEKIKEKQDDEIRSIHKESRAYKNQIEKYQAISTLLAGEEECQRRQIALQGLEDSDATRLRLLDQIDDLTKRQQELTSEEKRLVGEIKQFIKQYQIVFDHDAQIEIVIHDHQKLTKELAQAQLNETSALDVVSSYWKSLSSEPWNDQFGAQVSQLDLEQLLDILKQYQELHEQKKQIQEDIRKLQASEKKAKHPPIFILPLLTFIQKTILRFARKDYIPTPSELQMRQASFQEVAESIQQKRATIREALDGLPVKKELLENLSIDLYEGLSALKTAYDQLVETRRKRSELDEYNNGFRNQVSELVATLGLTTSGDLSTWIEELIRVISDGQRIKAVALKAKQELEEGVRPKIATTRLELQSLREQLEKLDRQLQELGDGSVQQGLNRIQEYNHHHAEIAKTKQEFEARYPDFSLIAKEIRDKGWSTIKADFEATIDAMGDRIRAIKSELKSINAEVEKYPLQYFGIDEPIRRFLLYGGATAEDFLVDSVKMFAEIKAGEMVERLSDLSIRPGVVNRFLEWWEFYKLREAQKMQREEEVNLATGERFRAPQIIFDSTTIEILVKVPTQRCLRPDRGTTICLEVYSTGSQKPVYVERLNPYKRSKGLVETQPQEFVLPALSSSFRFLLTSGESVIHEWEIGVPGDGIQYMAFLAESGKYVNDVILPKASLIMVIKEGVILSPQECILVEGGHLFGSWREYCWYQVDLSELDEFELHDECGRSLSIPLASYIVSSITLIGGTCLEGVSSDERPIYTVAPHGIRIPVGDRADLSLIRISLLTDEGHSARMSKHYQVSDLMDIVDDHIEEGWLDIPLRSDMLLGQDPLGGYYLRVFKPPYLDWTQSFAIIPDLEVRFDQAFYSPYKDETAIVKATIVTPQFCSLQLDKPAYVTPKNRNTYLIQTQVSKNEFTGELESSSSEEDKITIPFTISIPKIKWRIQGLSNTEFDGWIDQMKDELWLGDWINAQELFLLIQTPQTYDGSVSLVLSENSVTVDGRAIRDCIIRFDLKALEDRLRSGPALETFNLSLTNKSTQFPIFSIRTRWQAENIKCFHFPDGDMIYLNITWDEKGKADEKIVRLWSLSVERAFLVRDKKVSQNIHEVQFKFGIEDLKSGKYLIQIAPFDPWAAKPATPSASSQNSILIDIFTKTPEGTVTLCKVWVDDLHGYSLPEGSYKIHIKGKVSNRKLPEDLDMTDIENILVTPLNEDWYVGALEVQGVREVTNKLADTNPVKFEYDPHRHIITSIEDRHGDGAVYCYQCKMLFWNQGTVLKEKLRKHRNYGPIEKFGVSWESK